MNGLLKCARMGLSGAIKEPASVSLGEDLTQDLVGQADWVALRAAGGLGGPDQFGEI
jgi:hypothetical protein